MTHIVRRNITDLLHRIVATTKFADILPMVADMTCNADIVDGASCYVYDRNRYDGLDFHRHIMLIRDFSYTSIEIKYGNYAVVITRDDIDGYDLDVDINWDDYADGTPEYSKYIEHAGGRSGASSYSMSIFLTSVPQHLYAYVDLSRNNDDEYIDDTRDNRLNDYVQRVINADINDECRDKDKLRWIMVLLLVLDYKYGMCESLSVDCIDGEFGRNVNECIGKLMGISNPNWYQVRA